jgi:hypothetical protein
MNIVMFRQDEINKLDNEGRLRGVLEALDINKLSPFPIEQFHVTPEGEDSSGSGVVLCQPTFEDHHL